MKNTFWLRNSISLISNPTKRSYSTFLSDGLCTNTYFSGFGHSGKVVKKRKRPHRISRQGFFSKWVSSGNPSNRGTVTRGKNNQPHRPENSIGGILSQGDRKTHVWFISELSGKGGHRHCLPKPWHLPLKPPWPGLSHPTSFCDLKCTLQCSKSPLFGG